ncbi:MAG: hypothetical protein WKF65_09755 [Gaiellaceae bacterium]
MPVGQELIILMNLPLPQLRRLAKAAGVFPEGGMTKWDYAN